MGPAALPVMIGLTAASAVYSAHVARQQGKFQAALAARQAEFQRQQADQVREAGEAQERRLRERGAQMQGLARARALASGLDISFGSPADVIASNAAMLEEDALTARANAYRQAWGLDTQAVFTSAQGEWASRAGNMQAFGSLLQGASQISTAIYMKGK